MKKVWKQPLLETLDVNMTMGGTNYSHFDSDYTDHTTIPLDSNGHPLVGAS